MRLKKEQRSFITIRKCRAILCVTGNNVSMSKYKGMVLVIVNLASECGLTDRNYKELTILQKVNLSVPLWGRNEA